MEKIKNVRFGKNIFCAKPPTKEGIFSNLFLREWKGNTTRYVGKVRNKIYLLERCRYTLRFSILSMHTLMIHSNIQGYT